MRRPWSFQPLRAPDGGGDGGVVVSPPAPAAVDPPAPVAPPAVEPPAAPVTATRPDWLPEDQWDATAGKPKFDVAELVTLKAKEAERAALVPADAAGYKVELPADAKITIAEDDPLLGDARTFAKEAGLTQAQFAGMLALRVKMEAAAEAAGEAQARAELAALGSKAQDRITGATTFLRATLPPDQFEALKGAVTSAKAVEAVETLMSKIAGPVIPGSGAAPATKNPWAADSFNMTEQGRMLLAAKTDPNIARQVEQFRAAAGNK